MENILTSRKLLDQTIYIERIIPTRREILPEIRKIVIRVIESVFVTFFLIIPKSGYRRCLIASTSRICPKSAPIANKKNILIAPKNNPMTERT